MIPELLIQALSDLILSENKAQPITYKHINFGSEGKYQWTLAKNTKGTWNMVPLEMMKKDREVMTPSLNWEQSVPLPKPLSKLIDQVEQRAAEDVRKLMRKVMGIEV